MMGGMANDAGPPMLWPTVRPDDDERVAAPGTLSVCVVCDGPDALHGRASVSGTHIGAGPHDTDHGSREVAVRDPEGNHWTFGTYRGGRGAAPASGPGT